MLNLAFKADEQLEKIGVSHDDLIHDMSLARERKIMKNQFFKLLIGFGFPIGAITIAMIFVTGHLANTIWDRAAETFRLLLKNDIKELALPAHSSSGSRVDLRSLASGVNEIMLPAAEELNPTFRALTETDARGVVLKQ